MNCISHLLGLSYIPSLGHLQFFLISPYGIRTSMILTETKVKISEFLCRSLTATDNKKKYPHAWPKK